MRSVSIAAREHPSMRFLVVASLMICSVEALAQGHPFVRVKLVPAGSVVVGQPLKLIVDVMVPNFFTGAPGFPELELNNALVILSQDTPQNINEQIAGISYAGISQFYTVYPEAAGEFQLPPATIAVSYAKQPPTPTLAEVAIPPLKFTAIIPAAARQLTNFVATTKLQMQQTWEPSLKDLYAGDTVTRTITVTTLRLQGMFIPPIVTTVPDGLRAYPNEPEVRDFKTPRGEFIYGQRVQSEKFFIQKEGNFAFPPIEVAWWNLAQRRVSTTSLPAVHFAVAPAANTGPELPPEQPAATGAPAPVVHSGIRYKFWIYMLASAVLAAVLLLYLGRRYGPTFVDYLKRLMQLRRDSEGCHFRRLVRASRRNAAPETYRLLLIWLNHAYPGATLEGYLSNAGDESLTRRVHELGAALYRKEVRPSWDGNALTTLLRHHHRTVLVQKQRSGDLPELNPQAPA
jgi:hypothetical protein